MARRADRRMRLMERQPRRVMRGVAAYSATVLLYSIVETQLHAFAEYIGKKRGSELRVNVQRAFTSK